MAAVAAADSHLDAVEEDSHCCNQVVVPAGSLVGHTAVVEEAAAKEAEECWSREEAAAEVHLLQEEAATK